VVLRHAGGGRTIRVLVADEHAATRAGLRVALERDGLRVCGEVGDADEALAVAVRERPDVCLLDTDIPGGGIAAAAGIQACLPDTTVVMLAKEPSDPDLLDALRAGAAGYLEWDTNPDRLPAIVRGVLRGEVALSRRLVATLVEEFRSRGRRQRLELAGRPSVDLTDREWEVVQLLRLGVDTADIAERLFVSTGTVRTHVAAILRKLGVPDREALLELLGRR
jgi:two-component system NarL family response regulator